MKTFTNILGKNEIYGILIFVYFLDMILESSKYSDVLFFDVSLSILRVMILACLLVMARRQFPRIKQNEIPVMMLFVFFSLANMVFSGGGFRFLIVLLFVVHARNVDIEHIYDHAFKALSISSLIVVVSSLAGIIPDDINTRNIEEGYQNLLTGEYTRHSYGFLMSNIIPFILSYLYLYRIAQKKKEMSIFEHLLFQMVNVFTFFACGSRVVFLVIIMVGILHVCLKIMEKVFEIRVKIPGLLTIMFPGLTIGCFGIAYVFGRTSMNTVNIFFNFRFSKLYRTIDYFGLHLIGNESNVGTLDSLNGVVVDNGYAMLFLQKGLVVGAIVIGIWTWITYKAAKNNNPYIITAVVALAVLNFIDYHFISFMNIPFYCLLAHENTGFVMPDVRRRITKRRSNIYESRNCNFELQKL